MEFLSSKMKQKLQTLLFIVVTTGTTCVNAGTITNGFGNRPIQVKETSPTYVPQRCLVKPEPGRCRAWIPQYYFNTSSRHCQEFIYGGCGGNTNRFQTFGECQKTCACKTAPETGPCRGHIQRWFYSPKDRVCRPFVFGGCGGNSNNYGSWYECSNSCGYPDHNNSWRRWWKSEGQGRWGEGVSGAASRPGYSKADFMKDYMMLGMVGEMELEGMGAIMKLYRQLQKMGGLSTMQSGRARAAEGSNTARAGSAGMRTSGHGQNYNWGESASSWGSQSGTGSHNAGIWGQGSSGQTGVLENGQLESNGFKHDRTLGGGYDAFTPLGHRGDGARNTFTPLGERGSLTNVIGTGTSNMAQELQMLKSILGSGAYGGANFNFGSSGSSSFDVNGWVPSGGFNVVEFIKQLAAGRLTPNAMMILARTLGAVDRTGKIDINVMLSQLSQTMANLGLDTNQQLKRVAQGFGALDMYGNIDKNRFLHGIAGSIGGLIARMSRVVGPGATWPVDTSKLGTNFVAFINQLGSGRLSPADMSIMAKSLGVLDSRGKININAMVKRLMDALSNPGIAADLQGTAKRLGAVDNNGNINVQVFLSKLAGSVGAPHSGFGTSGSEILQFISLLASRRATHQDIQTMASKVGAVDNYGNINFSLLGKGIVGALRNPATTADLKGIARHVGALDKTGNIDLSMLLRGVTGVLKGALGGVGGAMGGYKGSVGSPGRTSEARVIRATTKQEAKQ